MGLTFSSFLSRLFNIKPMRILMVGLPGAGKTTTLSKLNLGDIVTTTPAIGFNVKNVAFKKGHICFTAWDAGVSGDQDNPLLPQLLPLLRQHYFSNTRCLIFVVDSSDRDRVGQAREELHNLLAEEQLKEVPLLVFANKTDLPDAMCEHAVTHQLGLNEIRNRRWLTLPTCATSGEGLYDGLDWLLEVVKLSMG